MDLHKAAIKSDFVTYVDSKQSREGRDTTDYSPKKRSSRHEVKISKIDSKSNKKIKCTCRCTCSNKSGRHSNSDNAHNTNSQTSSNSDICRETFIDRTLHCGTLSSPVISDFIKSYSAQNSPIHQLNINQNHDPERSYSFTKSALKRNDEYLVNTEKIQNFAVNSIFENSNNQMESSSFDTYDSPEMIDILRKLEIKSEKLKNKMNALDGIRDGILKQLENALTAEQTNNSLSSSDRTDSKDSGMASISNDQTKPSHVNNKFPVKSILKKSLKYNQEEKKLTEKVLTRKEYQSINLTDLCNSQTGNCSKWHWQRKFPQQTLYCFESDPDKCRRRSFDINNPCFSNVEYNCYSHSDLTSDHKQRELLYNENSSKATVNQYDETEATTNSDAIDIICFLENQLSDPPSPAPQLPDDVYFK